MLCDQHVVSWRAQQLRRRRREVATGLFRERRTSQANCLPARRVAEESEHRAEELVYSHEMQHAVGKFGGEFDAAHILAAMRPPATRPERRVIQKARGTLLTRVNAWQHQPDNLDHAASDRRIRLPWGVHRRFMGPNLGPINERESDIERRLNRRK